MRKLDSSAQVLADATDLLGEGRLRDASEAVGAALVAAPAPAEVAGRLRLLLSSILLLTGHPDEAAVHADVVLTQPGYPDLLYGGADLVFLQAYTATGRDAQTRRLAEAILAGERPGGDVALGGALVAVALLAWDGGRFADALAFLRAAVHRADAEADGLVPAYPGLHLAAMLTSLGEYDESEDLLAGAAEDVRLDRDAAWAPAVGVCRAHLLLARGDVREADAEAERAALGADELGTATSASPAWALRASAALARGDVVGASRQIARCRASACGDPGVRRSSTRTWAEARLAEAQQGPHASLAVLAAACDRPSGFTRLLADSPERASWWLRCALAADDRPRAALIAMVMHQLAASNPEFVALTAGADHCNGLLGTDIEALDRAARLYPQPWAAASAGEDAAVAVGAGDRAGSRGRLERSLVAYERAGTSRDADRVRRRSRLSEGVGRATRRPVSGWASLTDGEERVALVVADGLTNAEAAGRLYLSRHTVDFHLRQVFRKLGINSRVGLARLAVLRQEGMASLPVVGAGAPTPTGGMVRR